MDFVLLMAVEKGVNSKIAVRVLKEEAFVKIMAAFLVNEVVQEVRVRGLPE